MKIANNYPSMVSNQIKNLIIDLKVEERTKSRRIDMSSKTTIALEIVCVIAETDTLRCCMGNEKVFREKYNQH